MTIIDATRLSTYVYISNSKETNILHKQMIALQNVYTFICMETWSISYNLCP